jgi:uncharacterized damage-inducible protein DinB
MMYYGSKELAASFRTVRGNTIQIAEDIPAAQYDFRPAADTRNVGQLLVHIAVTSHVQHYIQSNKITDLTKVNFLELRKTLVAEEAKSRSKDEVLALLRAEGEKFASYLENLSEPFLGETVAMHPGTVPATKSRLEMLLSVKEHEMHHRGQLMLIERMLGLVPHLTRQYQERMAQAQAQQPTR